MFIVIGLGNPGEQYKKTRHNVGFMAVDQFAKKNNFPDFELQKKANALISERDGILLAKPQTFMNESGKAVLQLTRNTQIENLVVIHDDVDLPVGKLKIIKERGSAGHKGVESVIKAIGNENLIRIRIGIAPVKDIEAKKIVLKNFSKEEQKEIENIILKISDAIALLKDQGLDKAMNEYN